ncbi:protein kinase domain-containing protein [Fusobacterium sp. PH5-44]|uniref:protein kinase domain-containing protein n=1 Tax=unclassified Fusobacterium TaxID=2648384 RepID=UPI003D204633
MEKKQLDTILLREGERFSVYLESYENGHKEILKVINPECLEDLEKYKKILRQFNIEKKILRDMNIENIPKYIDDGRNYLNMSYIRGKDLNKLVKTRTLSFYDKIHIMSNLFFILRKIHDNNIIHCDIKPSNIIWGINNEIHIIDFGSATRRGESSVYIQGSDGFSPPETYKLREKKDYANDIYSLVAVAYWLKYQEKYSLDRNFYEFDHFLMQGLEKNPKKRFGSLNEILEIIKNKNHVN